MVDPLTLVLGSVATGGVATVIVQAIIQHSSQRRQLYLDIAKDKYETIQQTSNDYVLMASALKQFKLANTDEEKFFSMCNFFLHYKNVAYGGGIELDTIEGEDIIERLIEDIFTFFEGLQFEELSEMANLVKPLLIL